MASGPAINPADLGAPIIDPKDLGGTATPAPKATAKPGKSILQNVGDVADRAYRNVGAAYTSAARNPVGAAFNILGAPLGALEGIAVGHGDDAMRAAQAGKDPDAVPNDLASAARDAWRGATDPVARNRYSEMINEAAMGPEPKNPTMPQRIARGAGGLGVASVLDPVTHGGPKAMELAGELFKPLASAAAQGAPKAVAAIKNLASPKVQHALGVLSHAVGEANPLKSVVNVGKELLFTNPLVHGVGNLGTNNWLANGAPTAAKGLWYGLRGAPKASAEELNRIGAGAYTPELMGKLEPWGPYGLMQKLGQKGVPAAVRAAGGGAAGGAIANQTAPSTDTNQQRLTRALEGTILGAIGGAGPEALAASNKIMSRLEMGHRAAMLEGLPKPVAAAGKAVAKTPKNLTKTFTKLVQTGKVPEAAQERILAHLSQNQNMAPAELNSYLQQELGDLGFLPKPIDSRAAKINEVFGGGEKSGAAKLVTAAGGPYAAWNLDIVPRVVGRSIKNAPARVGAVVRGQDIANRDVLKDKPYQLRVGGPIGSAAELAVDPLKYGERMLGPLGNLLGASGDATNPQTLSAKDKIGSAIYDATPGRSAVGPFFGDTMYKSKAPAIPSASLSALLGWHFANKTPRQDAILSIMKASGLDATQAANVYDRYKK
jgi:hypothetical protein